MNVIWLVSDSLRRDHVGCYGNDKIRTPALDALAAKSVRLPLLRCRLPDLANPCRPFSWSLDNLPFHRPSDSKQEKNVIGEHLEVASELHQLLIKFMRDYNAAPELIEIRLNLGV